MGAACDVGEIKAAKAFWCRSLPVKCRPSSCLLRGRWRVLNAVRLLRKHSWARMTPYGEMRIPFSSSSSRNCDITACGVQRQQQHPGFLLRNGGGTFGGRANEPGSSSWQRSPRLLLHPVPQLASPPSNKPPPCGSSLWSHPSSYTAPWWPPSQIEGRCRDESRVNRGMMNKRLMRAGNHQRA